MSAAPMPDEEAIPSPIDRATRAPLRPGDPIEAGTRQANSAATVQ